MKKQFKSMCLLLALIIIFVSIDSSEVSADQTIYLNDTGKIRISASWGKPAAGFYFLSTGQNGPVGNPLGGEYVTSFTTNIDFKATKLGKQEITMTLDVSDADGNKQSVNPVKVVVNVVEKPAPNPTTPKPTTPKPTTPKPSLPQVDNTEQEKKTAEQKAKEELEKRMKTPLLREIEIVSKSERLKGEVVELIEPQSGKFDYTVSVPWNINDLAITPKIIKEDVKLEFDENISFEEGASELKLVIKAVQDKLEQEFTINFKKPEASKLELEVEGKKLKQVVDSYLDKAMAELGFEKKLINEEEPSLGFSYLFNENSYVVVEDEEGRLSTYLLDENLDIVREVFIVSNQDNKTAILINEILPVDDGRILNGNLYTSHEIEISPLLTGLDPSFKFNNVVHGWSYEGGCIITHGLDDNNEAELVHFDKLSGVKSAFVSFDEKPNKSINIISYMGYGLWLITLIAFIAYRVKISREYED